MSESIDTVQSTNEHFDHNPQAAELSERVEETVVKPVKDSVQPIEETVARQEGQTDSTADHVQQDSTETKSDLEQSPQDKSTEQPIAQVFSPQNAHLTIVDEAKSSEKPPITKDKVNETSVTVNEDTELKEAENKETEDEVTESGVVADVLGQETSDVKSEEQKAQIKTAPSEEYEDVKVGLQAPVTVIDKEEPKEESRKIEDFINQAPKQEEITALSDDDIIIDGISSDSDSDSGSSSSSDSSSESDSEDDEPVEFNANAEESDEEGETISGPIKSKNEILDEDAPTLPEDYTIPENAPIEPVGIVTGLVENSVIIKANVSGEFRVLKDQSILCLEDRTLIGPLFETFGRLQNPVYRVKFNTIEEFEKFKDIKGKTVYYVVPDSHFIYTDTIKSIKGTDASNCHDEELPEEEQEFSDDEKELEMKQLKKKGKKKAKKTSEDGTKEARKRPNPQNKSESDPKRFQPYGYAQPQLPPQPQAQPTHEMQHPRQSNDTYQTQYHSSPYGQPMMGYQNPVRQSSPYGVPFNQAQQDYNNPHQVYNQMQQPHFANPSLPAYPGPINAYGNPNVQQHNQWNQWNQQPQQQNQINYQAASQLGLPGYGTQIPPNTLQQQHLQQSTPANALQQQQLQQLQRLIVNQFNQQNNSNPQQQPRPPN